MILKGKKGAVHFIYGTGMYLDKTHKYWNNKGLHEENGTPDYMGYDVGYHTAYPHYKEQTKQSEKCEWIGGPCYCDGSAMRGDEFMKILIEKGSDEIWKLLEEDYNALEEK